MNTIPLDYKKWTKRLEAQWRSLVRKEALGTITIAELALLNKLQRQRDDR